VSPSIELDAAMVRTNIIVFRIAPAGPDAATLVARARDRGVLVVAFGPRTVRAVTHLDVDTGACRRAAAILAEAAAVP
jgi:threonine aldolase